MIPILFVFLTTSLLAGVSIQQADALSHQSGYAVDDLRMAARTESVAGNYLHDYSRLGVRHSVNQKAYDLASSGGNMNWNGDAVENDRVSATKALRELESASENYMQQNYIQGFRPSNCDVNLSRYDISTSRVGDRLSVLYSPESSAAVVCSFSKGNATYEIDTGVSPELDLETNRYAMIVSETDYVLEQVESAWDDTDRTYTATARSCGSTDGLLQDAEDKAESDADDEFENDAMDSYSPSDLSSGFDIESRSFGINSYTETSSIGPTDTGNQCGCTCQSSRRCSGGGGRQPTGGSLSRPPSCGAGSCSPNEIQVCDTEYEATSSIEVDSAEASLEIKDEEHKVLTSGGYRSLVFEVSNYIQEFN